MSTARVNNKSVRVTLPLGETDKPVAVIAAFDPGGTTGYSWYSPFSGKVQCAQLGPGPHYVELMNVVIDLSKYAQSMGSHLVIVYEQFEFRQDYGSDKVFRAVDGLISKLKTGNMRKLSEVIGALESLLEMRTNRDRLVLISREYIGVLNLAARQDKTIEIVAQSASEALWFVKDVKLQALGWYTPTKGMQHARDSLRHLLRHLVVTCKVKSPITTAWFSGRPGVVYNENLA
jgi:hypothetical protein